MSTPTQNQMIAPGTYRARGRKATLATASTGTEQVVVEFELAETGERIPWFGYFTPKAQERTIESLRLCGWAGDNLADLDGIDRNEVEIVIAHEEDLEGRLRARVRWVNELGRVAVANPMDEMSKRTFAERMRGVVVAHDQKTKDRPKPSKPRPITEAEAGEQHPDDAKALSDDDIPFRQPAAVKAEQRRAK